MHSVSGTEQCTVPGSVPRHFYRFPGPSPKLENQNFRDCAQGSVLFECSSNDSDRSSCWFGNYIPGAEVPVYHPWA